MTWKEAFRWAYQWAELYQQKCYVYACKSWTGEIYYDWDIYPRGGAPTD